MNYPTPYYAVIFTSKLINDEGYRQMSEAMLNLVQQQEGFIGVDSARSELGITVSYWKDLESIKAWRNHPEHRVAMQLGKEKWYEYYSVKLCKVERAYDLSLD